VITPILIPEASVSIVKDWEKSGNIKIGAVLMPLLTCEKLYQLQHPTHKEYFSVVKLSKVLQS